MMSSFTLILLPGMLGTEDLFGPLLSVLPEKIRRGVISYPTDRVMSYGALLELIEGELRDEGEMVILGESFAGAIALAFAVAHPDRVRGVILSASFVRPPLPTWLRWLVHPFILRIPLPSFLVRFFVAGWDASDEFVEMVKGAVGKPSAIVLAGRVKDALTVNCVEVLRRCGTPILYLAPTRDHLVRRFCLRTILRLRPDVRVSEIEGPHLILQRKPGEAWRAIEDFVATLDQAKAS